MARIVGVWRKMGMRVFKRRILAHAQAETNNYSLLFPAFFALAHLAFANAASLALPAADSFLLGY